MRKYISSAYKTTVKDLSGGQLNSQGVATFSAQVVDAEGKV